MSACSKIILSVIFLSDLTAFARPSPLVQDLIKEAIPYVRTLNRPTYFYHYVKMNDARYGKLLDLQNPESGLLSLEDPKVLERFKSVARAFWGPSVSDRSDVDGLYAAPDPFVSRHFGGQDQNWVLLRIELPQGHRYLDLVAWNSRDPFSSQREIPDDLAFRIKEANCSVTDYFIYLFKKKDSPGCRQLAHEVLRELRVDSMFYDWCEFKFKQCTKSLKSSVILINENFISSRTARVFQEKIPEVDSDSDERDLLESLALDADLDYLNQHSRRNSEENREMVRPFWPDRKFERISESVLKEWETNYLYQSAGDSKN